LKNQIKSNAYLKKMIEGKEHYQGSNFADPSWQPYIQVARK